MTTIWRIPTKGWYKKNNLTGKTWNELYGKCICKVCRQHFKEKEAYTHHEKGFRHVECPRRVKG